MINFEIDCGEVFQGHRLLATGLRMDGMSGDAVHADYSEHTPGKPAHPMVSLTYVIVPGIDPTTLRGRDIDADVRIEPPADPGWWEPVESWGGEREVPPEEDSPNRVLGALHIDLETASARWQVA